MPKENALLRRNCARAKREGCWSTLLHSLLLPRTERFRILGFCEGNGTKFKFGATSNTPARCSYSSMRFFFQMIQYMYDMIKSGTSYSAYNVGKIRMRSLLLKKKKKQQQHDGNTTRTTSPGVLPAVVVPSVKRSARYLRAAASLGSPSLSREPAAARPRRATGRAPAASHARTGSARRPPAAVSPAPPPTRPWPA